MARNAEFLFAAQLLLFGALYDVAIASFRRGDVATHMRCMICIALVLLPAGLARSLGYWFYIRQSSSQTVCFVAIDVMLIALVLFDNIAAWHALTWRCSAYVVIETVWTSLGRPV
ncbi:MAG: hypothetical protein WA715_11765 [Candidatus Acidiferrum sp.]|jgi:hypothetical protein